MKKIISALCALTSFTLVNAATITPTTPSVDEDSGCLIISSPNELYGFAEFIGESEDNRSSCAILTKNIVVNENIFDNEGILTTKVDDLIPWTPILNYKGVFDGKGHTISGLYVDDEENERVGFFGSLINGTKEAPTTVKNVGIIHSYFKGKKYVGNIVANIRTDAFVNLDEVFSNSVSIGDTCGGLVGYSKSSTTSIKNSYFTGQVQGEHLAGGLVSYAGGAISISNSYTIGLVSSEKIKAALVAHLKSETNVTIQNTFILDSFEEKGTESSAIGAIKASKSEFENGTIALKLREYKENSVWGQDVKKDASPTLSGEIKNATISSLTLTTFEGDKTVFANQYIEGIETILPTPSRSGYTFGGWFKNNKFEGDAVKKISKDTKGKLTFFAKWNVLQCTVKLSVNDTVMGSVSGGGKFDCGSKITIKASAKSGFKFSKWNDDNTNAERNITVEKDTSFKASFKALSSSSSVKSSSSSKKVSSSSVKSSSSSKKISSSSIKSSSSKAVSSSSKKSIADIKIVTIKPSIPDTLNGCYQIGTAEELYGFAAIVNGTDGMKKNDSACGELTSSIVVNKNILDKHDELNTDRAEITPWTPIKGFKGYFNGHSYKISGLYLSKSGQDSVGLFGVVTGGGEKEPIVIENVGLVDSYFDCGSAVGGIVGAVVNAHLQLSHVYNRSTIKGYNNVGGLVGAGVIDTKNDTLTQYTMHITNAFNSGSTEASFTCGGLIGIVGESVSITNAYNFGTFKGTEHTDILIGYNFMGISVSLLNTFFPNIFTSRYGGDPMDPDDFENETLLKQLKAFNRKNVDGRAWDKVVGSDLPGFPAPDDESIPDAIAIAHPYQKINIHVQGKNLWINGTNKNDKIIVTDIQGHIISKGNASLMNYTITLPNNGAYIVRVGGHVKTIRVK